MPDLQNLFDRSAKAAGTAAYWTTRAARFMSYVEFFRERQQARYAVGKGRFRGCC